MLEALHTRSRLSLRGKRGPDVMSTVPATSARRPRAGGGDSVPTANVTFFSTHHLRSLERPRSPSPSLRSWIPTPTARPSVYCFKPDLQRSKGARTRGIASQRHTAESAAPTTGANRMACCMASHACLARAQPLPLLRRVALLPSPTHIAQTGTISMIDSLSPHLIGGLLELCI